ncbi:hypothetical protein BJ165DRAFT_1591571 [Panaeolus papilionaceus]|nr:hypothetical protein BJ165DRAFT_1591571 [Panaeolus papilionaceus]
MILDLHLVRMIWCPSLADSLEFEGVLWIWNDILIPIDAGHLQTYSSSEDSCLAIRAGSFAEFRRCKYFGMNEGERSNKRLEIRSNGAWICAGLDGNSDQDSPKRREYLQNDKCGTTKQGTTNETVEEIKLSQNRQNRQTNDSTQVRRLHEGQI